ncbi:unnamed protein product [Rhizophagus irregularis]|nr:unnamed protein product [Rhizophagus irregularis]
MAPVKLYIYDLSRGMARALSMGFTGRQLDGIWHTSVVVYVCEFLTGRNIPDYIINLPADFYQLQWEDNFVLCLNPCLDQLIFDFLFSNKSYIIYGIGKIVHFAADAVLVSAVLAGIKRSNWIIVCNT